MYNSLSTIPRKNLIRITFINDVDIVESFLKTYFTLQ